LLEIAESQGDMATVAALTGHAGMTAAEAGDLDGAARYWRRAIAAGSTDEKVADRFSVWLANRHEYPEAAHVLRQALIANPDSGNISERMRRRLTRCERMQAALRRPFPDVAAAHREFETLACSECGQTFQRSRIRGRKPLRCPSCAAGHLAIQ